MKKRFKPLIKISVEESLNYIPIEKSFKNEESHFYTLSPSTDLNYPASEGWEDVKYFTKRKRRI